MSARSSRFGIGQVVLSRKPERMWRCIMIACVQESHFARAGLTVSWDSKIQSLLELAETCDVPVRWSCRAGVCHTCECGLISGSVKYDPEPLEPAAAGNLLICCSRPQEDV